MITNHIPIKGVFYSSKQADKVAVKTRGSVGWSPNDEGFLEEFIFHQVKGQSGTWLPQVEYRRIKSETAKRNFDFYKANPGLLRQKIRERKGSFMESYVFGLCVNP